jgi:hypothetical protein
VLYADGRQETVTDVWEYYQRSPVRELCYIDGENRPHIKYSKIKTIDFEECGEEKRKTAITVTLRDGSTEQGLLWDNDSFYATNRDGTEWRGWIAGLKKLVFKTEVDTTQAGGAD